MYDTGGKAGSRTLALSRSSQLSLSTTANSGVGEIVFFNNAGRVLVEYYSPTKSCANKYVVDRHLRMVGGYFKCCHGRLRILE
jgi:hypothetical protein